jgi:hypothetical protein
MNLPVGVDYREFIEDTTDEKYPLLHIDDTLHRQAGASWYSTL